MDAFKDISPNVNINDGIFTFAVCILLYDKFFKICHSVFNAQNSNGYSASAAFYCNYRLINDINVFHNGFDISKNV